MGTTNFKASLEKRYAALKGELEQTEQSLDRLRQDQCRIPELMIRVGDLRLLLKSAERLLVDADRDWQAKEIRAVRPWTHQLPVPFGSCGRRALAVLRESDKPMTAREIAMKVLREVGCDKPDQATAQRTVNTITSTLHRYKGKTVESSGKFPAQWRTVVKTGVSFDP